MQRAIAGYRKDEEGHWVALLDCGHPQHVRDHPPLKSRPWVLTEAGRSAHLGSPLDCVRCNCFEMPPHFVEYKRTPVFTQDTLPEGLRREHSTGPGIWARVVVEEGRLRYQVPALDRDDILTPDHQGLVIPEVPHSVQPLGAVRFFLEFFAAPLAPQKRNNPLVGNQPEKKLEASPCMSQSIAKRLPESGAEAN